MIFRVRGRPARKTKGFMNSPGWRRLSVVHWVCRQRSGASGMRPFAQPGDLLPDGGQQGAPDGANRRTAAEGGGDGVKGAEREMGLVGDGVDRLPVIRLEFGLEGVQALEVVEAPTVRPRPGQQQTQPGEMQAR